MTDIILHLVKTIIGYLILLYLSINLLGMVARGFYDKIDKSEIAPFLHKEVGKINRAGGFSTILFIFITIVYYYLLYHFWKIGVVLSAAMLMIGRVHDLLWEIHNGRKVTSMDHPKGILSIISDLLTWGAIIVLWFALY